MGSLHTVTPSCNRWPHPSKRGRENPVGTNYICSQENDDAHYEEPMKHQGQCTRLKIHQVISPMRLAFLRILCHHKRGRTKWKRGTWSVSSLQAVAEIRPRCAVVRAGVKICKRCFWECWEMLLVVVGGAECKECGWEICRSELENKHVPLTMTNKQVFRDPFQLPRDVEKYETRNSFRRYWTLELCSKYSHLFRVNTLKNHCLLNSDRNY